MKRPQIAAVLNFLIPGVGLLYLRKWGWAALNFLGVDAILATCFLIDPELFMDSGHYFLLALAAGSAGLAHAVAIRVASSDSQ